MRAIAVVVLFVTAASAGPYGLDNRIIGGELTTIDNYPEMVALLYDANAINFRQFCGGSLLNERFILTAAHCFNYGREIPAHWRIRVGSSFATSGGQVHNIAALIIHHNYVWWFADYDIAIMRTASFVNYENNAVQAATIAGSNYYPGDDQVVWAAGWGVTETGWPSEQLRHVQIWTVSQAVCRERYGASLITDNMLCAGWLDVGGRDQCSGDSGGPLFHNHIVVGICSWGSGCARPYYPGVNVRVSRFTSWIQANAV